jgi:cobalt-zinc-cadmium efflux system outer membrane protein
LERLRAVGDETRSYKEEIVPASIEAFEAMSLGFREGKFGFLEVLDAQRSLSEAALLLLESQQRHSAARAELERLVGSSLDEHTDAAATANNPTQGEVQ